jgi:hypothetical protein
MKYSHLVVAVCASVVVGSVSAAENVVLESNAVRYAAGSSVDAALPIVLERGEFVLLTTEDARFLRVEGPHNGPAEGPAPEESALRRALELLVAGERTQVGSVGGVRAADLPSASTTADGRPDPWLLHAERNGDQCVLRGTEPTLWRERAGDAESWEIAAAGAAQPATLRFAAGEQRAPWPAGLVPQEAEIYLVRPTAAQRSVAIRLHLLDPRLADNALAAAAWLAAKGCRAQARLLLR